jgi:predicted enzyme related to lactoylglutathione lyase
VTWKLSEGDWCHVEIPAKDRRRLRTFYGEVFSWTFTEYPDLDMDMIQTSPDGIESTIGTLGQNEKIVSFLLVNGTVEDMRRKAERVVQAGGSVVKEPTEIPGVGAFAYLSDPEGNVFGFWQDAPSQEGSEQVEEPHTHEE